MKDLKVDIEKDVWSIKKTGEEELRSMVPIMMKFDCSWKHVSTLVCSIERCEMEVELKRRRMQSASSSTILMIWFAATGGKDR